MPVNDGTRRRTRRELLDKIDAAFGPYAVRVPQELLDAAHEAKVSIDEYCDSLSAEHPHCLACQSYGDECFVDKEDWQKECAFFMRKKF